MTITTRFPDAALNVIAQFTIRRLFLWTLFFAAFAAIFFALPVTSLAFGVATFVAVFFVAVDVKFKRRFDGWLGVSYFACALAYIVGISYVMMQLYPPTPPPKIPLPFWSGLYYLVSGAFISEIAQEIATAISTIIYYLMTIMACTIFSTTIALSMLRRNRESKWLLVMNTPGILLTIYCIAAIIYNKYLAG